MGKNINKKKIIIIVVILLFILLIGFGIFKFVSSVKADKKQITDNINYINKNYVVFNQNIDSFTEKRNSLNEKMMDTDLYYGNLTIKNPAIVEDVTAYNNITKSLKSDSKILLGKCKAYYNDVQVNQKCRIIKQTYESALDTFKDDLEEYNKMIEDYNKWTDTNTKFTKLSIYKSNN